MQVDITGHRLEITDALRGHVEKHCRHIAGMAQTPPPRAHVVLGAAGQGFSCDMQMRLDGAEVVAKGEAADMYEAIDRTAEKIGRQVRENKGRRLARRHK